MILDIFDTDAFNMQSLTAAIDKLPYQAGRIGELGLFEQRPATTQHAVIEERLGSLALLPTQPRGYFQQTAQGAIHRKIRTFQIPHVPQFDTLLAGDLEGKRAFGTEDQVEVFSQILNDRLERMKQKHELTWEWHRVGALHGKILDADGTTVVEDYFADFGLTQTTGTVDFTDTGTYALPNPAVDMKVFAQEIIRAMQNALGNTPFTGIRAIAGHQFWDNFVHHGTVRKAYEYYQENSFIRETQIPGGSSPDGFKFADITWENYRGWIGTPTSPLLFFPTNTCLFVPEGVKGLFLEIPGPADFMETVNTRGQPLYVKQERMKFDMGVEIFSQSNVLFICTRPQALILITGNNFISGLQPVLSNVIGPVS
jgi:hypothetical protein